MSSNPKGKNKSKSSSPKGSKGKGSKSPNSASRVLGNVDYISIQPMNVLEEILNSMNSKDIVSVCSSSMKMRNKCKDKYLRKFWLEKTKIDAPQFYKDDIPSPSKSGEVYYNYYVNAVKKENDLQSFADSINMPLKTLLNKTTLILEGKKIIIFTGIHW